MSTAACEDMSLISVLNPRIFIDGDKWCWGVWRDTS